MKRLPDHLEKIDRKRQKITLEEPITSTLYIGRHVGIEKNLLTTVDKLQMYSHLSAFQIFISNPRGGRSKDRNAEELAEMNDLLKKKNLKLIVHSPYTLNLARHSSEIPWNFSLLLKELEYCNRMGSIGCVIHMGKALQNPQEEAEQRFIENVKSLICTVQEKKFQSKLIFETPAGQGSEIFSGMEGFSRLWQAFTPAEHKNLGVCIDTCHVFVSGVDIKTKESRNEYLTNLAQTIGLEHICVVHVNESVHELSSKKDRHANLSQKGKIGTDALLEFLQPFVNHHIPVILETPFSSFETIQNEITTLFHHFHKDK